MTPGPGIEPGPHWWEASAITTAPSLLPFASFVGLLLMRTVGYEMEMLNFEETKAGVFASDALSCVVIVPVQKAFCIVAARKLELEQKIDDAAVCGANFVLSLQFMRGKNAEEFFGRNHL